MTLVLFSYRRQSRARHRSMLFHHSARAFWSGDACSAFHTLIMSSSTCPTSPTMPTSTGTFLLIDDGSMSMWIFVELGEKPVSRPVMRSSNRAPMATMTSHPCMARLAS